MIRFHQKPAKVHRNYSIFRVNENQIERIHKSRNNCKESSLKTKVSLKLITFKCLKCVKSTEKIRVMFRVVINATKSLKLTFYEFLNCCHNSTSCVKQYFRAFIKIVQLFSTKQSSCLVFSTRPSVSADRILCKTFTAIYVKTLNDFSFFEPI